MLRHAIRMDKLPTPEAVLWSSLSVSGRKSKALSHFNHTSLTMMLFIALAPIAIWNQLHSYSNDSSKHTAGRVH
ncbi:hypothetical protein Dda3937_04358 [Dickeya dadantii 3937]|uniref:Uncharacterized protein n=1 Tax=Dickeya dadantii (strain 3937) TaxID=198628 RepID=E0SKI7_DICD3|nr:hypothetical protein Dda3937_04358 [Dickeya dadantii 3937]